MPKNGKNSKDYIKNLFNGEIYNENTQLFEPVPDADRLKVVIGSSTIKEGINLQVYGTVLYNCFIDWNPTDIQQLEGRVYRQGNTFNSVRIVNPLMIDSADIFLFQKLQEKTSRLNTIWATDGKTNVLNTEEFNPEELKYALIRDPEVIAELKSIEEKSKIEGKVISLNRQIDTIARIKENVATINSHFKTIKERLVGYRNWESTGDKLKDAEILVRLTNDVEKKQTDDAGAKLVSQYERNRGKNSWESYDQWQERIAKLDKGKISNKDVFTKHYEFKDFAVAVRDVVRAENDFIRQNGIEGFSLNNLAPLDDFLKDIEQKIADADKDKKHLESDEYKKALAKEEAEKREQNKLEYKPLEQNVADFCKLNYLLSDKKIKKGVTKFKSCPPMDDAGNRLIDADALAHLDTCIAHAGQTKDIYYNEETKQYTPEREAVHNKIINDLFENVKCVKKGAPIAVFTGGSPASGKTTYLKKIANYLLTPDVFKLDADEIRSKLPGYEGWNANATHKETQDIVNELLNRVGDGSCRYDFVYDGTMNKAQKYFSLINKVKGLGYKTFIIFFDIPYAVARERALNRYKKSGRYVPMEVIDDFFKVIPDHNGLTMGQYALNELKSQVDGYIVIDGITGQIISKGGEALPNERVYEGQAKIDFKKYQAGVTTVPVEPVIMQKELVAPTPPPVPVEKEKPAPAEKPVTPVKIKRVTAPVPAPVEPELVETSIEQSEIEDAAAKYGWTVKLMPNGYQLFTKRGINPADVIIKGKKYIIQDKSGTKLLSGNNGVANGVDKIIREYYYGTPIETVAPVEEKIKIDTSPAPPTQQEIKEAVDALRLLADDGNNAAKEAIEALNLLIG
jgi:predicted kinase